MSQSIVIDADFLSAFLKIERLHFVAEFYIVAFLLACKTTAFIDNAGVKRVIDDLAKLDHYRFRQDQLARLLG